MSSEQNNYREVKGNLITMAIMGDFDVIAHGCNCLCTMGAGIAPQMAKAFGADKFELEYERYRGDINKLGCIDYVTNEFGLTVVNAYTQYSYGRNHKDGVSQPLDYAALELCLKKMNKIFAGKRIGLPQIGCGLAGGSWSIVSKLIQGHLYDCDVTVVIYDGT